MRAATPLFVTAMLFGAARAEEVVDRTWGFAYKLPGLGETFAVPRPGVLYSGHVGARMRVEILVHESPEARTAAQWRDAARAGLAKDESVGGLRAEDRPRAALRYTREHLGAFQQPHGRAFYPRNEHQCFEVHAWLDDATPDADKRIGRALAALRLPRAEKGYGLRCQRAAVRTRLAATHPKTLLEGGLYYLVRDPIPDLAASILRRAGEEAGPDDLTGEERWKVHFHHGRALAMAERPRQAIEAYDEAGKAAPEARQRRAALYQLARCAAPLGELDRAFAALRGAFKDGAAATKGELSNDDALENCRKDTRWEQFWRDHVAGR